MSLGNPAGEITSFKDEVLRQFKVVREDIEKYGGQLDEYKDRLNVEMTNLKVEVATLKLKLSFMAGLYGVIGGAIPAVVAIALRFLKLSDRMIRLKRGGPAGVLFMVGVSIGRSPGQSPAAKTNDPHQDRLGGRSLEDAVQ